MSDQTTIQKNRGISPVWTLPLLALLICGWLVYKSYMEAGFNIEVYFDDASGITPEKTQVMYMGLPIGIVKKLTPDLESGKVTAEIRMARSTEEHMVEDAIFWLVKPEVSADKITGLGTILSGSYIGVRKGTSTIPARTFTALSSAPPLPLDAPGLHIRLRSKSLRSIQEGSGIFFKNLKVGSVQSYSLEQDESILLRCHILPEYSHLIHKNSRFYDASGVSFSGALTNLKVRMESLSSLFVGGIVVSTPEMYSESPAAENGDTFPLYEDYNSSKFGLSMTLKLASGKGIKEGVTKVMYRGIEAGYVDHITINDDEERSVTATILLDPRASMILRENTTFWMVSPKISIGEIKNIDTLISGPFITFKPGDGQFRDAFELSNSPAVQTPLRPGKIFELISGTDFSPPPGSPIHYRKFRIGEVIDTDLGNDRQTLKTTFFIEDEYRDLVRKDSVFIKSAGISMDASIAGLSVDTGPLLSLLKGGIDLINTKETREVEEAEEGTVFTVFDSIEQAVVSHPRLKDSGLYLHLTADQLDSYRIGTPILYKKIKVGEITGFSLNKSGKQIKITCRIEKQYTHLVNKSSRFYNTSGIRITRGQGGLSVETGSLESIFAGGIAFYTPQKEKTVTDFSTFPIHNSLKTAQSIDNANLQVTFKNGDALSAGAQVKYNGIPLGHVSEVRFSKDMAGVEAELSIEKQYLSLFREGTRIWLAQPSINLQGVKNLGAVIFGAHIAIQPGTGDFSTNFNGLEKPPQTLPHDFNGLNLLLEAKQLDSIEVGSPVYYRRVKIGEVTGYDLAYDFTEVLIAINIEEQYTPIVRQNTRFWNVSGVRVDGGLFSGISVATQSLNSIMSGGIALATPEKEEMGPPVASGFRFILHDIPEDVWQDWSPDIFTIAEEDGSLP